MSDFTLGSVRFSSRPSLRHALAGAATAWREMLRARATRRMLTEMDDRLLADIGVGRGDALAEAHRPMWDLAPPRRS